VGFVRAVDIEVLQPGNAVEISLAQRPEIEHVLGVAVHVQRAQLGQQRGVVGVPQRAVPVGGGAGCIDEAGVILDAPFAQFREYRSCCRRDTPHSARGGTAGAEVQDRIDIANRIVADREPEVVRPM
jgi:hypothetical protein